jgi:hypothetical protein
MGTRATSKARLNSDEDFIQTCFEHISTRGWCAPAEMTLNDVQLDARAAARHRPLRSARGAMFRRRYDAQRDKARQTLFDAAQSKNSATGHESPGKFVAVERVVATNERMRAVMGDDRHALAVGGRGRPTRASGH